MTEQQKGEIRRRLREETVKSCIKFEMRAVNKKDESERLEQEREPCSLLPGLESMAAWL